MSVPAEHPTHVWTEADWARALEGHEDLVDRLAAGDVDAVLDILNLHPDVDARWVRDAG